MKLVLMTKFEHYSMWTPQSATLVRIRFSLKWAFVSSHELVRTLEKPKGFCSWMKESIKEVLIFCKLISYSRFLTSGLTEVDSRINTLGFRVPALHKLISCANTHFFFYETYPLGSKWDEPMQKKIVAQHTHMSTILPRDNPSELHPCHAIIYTKTLGYRTTSCSYLSFSLYFSCHEHCFACPCLAEHFFPSINRALGVRFEGEETWKSPLEGLG